MAIKKFSETIRDTLAEEMRLDERVFLMGEDVGLQGGIFGCTRGLLEEFGEKRVRDTPISEAAIVGAGIGAGMTGLIPIVELMYMDFAFLAMDQLLNQAAKITYMYAGKVSLPLVVRGQQGIGRGNAATHSQSVEAVFMHIPAVKVVLPSTPGDAKGLLKTAIRDPNPVIFIEHKALYATTGEVPDSNDFTIPFGSADIKREGKDATIVATSLMVNRALTAAEKLAAEGIDVEVIDPRTLVPLDEEAILNSVKKTGRAVVVHEAHKTCGAGAEIASLVMEKAFKYLDAPVMRLGAKQCPLPFNLGLENAVIPGEKDIIDAVKRVCYR
ncbi:MAG: alpha-ketoacid dehydrogenase subunit beta [Spirochaetota bacterium]